MSESRSDVYVKYVISREDGAPIEDGARYFVLRLDTDRHARQALVAYINSLTNTGVEEDMKFANNLMEYLVSASPVGCRWLIDNFNTCNVYLVEPRSYHPRPPVDHLGGRAIAR